MFDSYLIKTGDTIENIAKKYHTNKEYLYDINNIYSDDELREGRELIVPSIEDVYFNTYKVLKGDTLYKISKEFNINPDLLSAINGINKEEYIYPNQELMVPKTGYSYYITAEGDTLKMVRDTFKTDYDKLLKNNKTIYLLPEQLIVMKKEKYD